MHYSLRIGFGTGISHTLLQTAEDALDQYIFGYVLLNDWSARDIQTWEYQPLGPFQGKATATTISAWIITSAALDPFWVSTPKRECALLDHLKDTRAMLYDVSLDVSLLTPDGTETAISKTNYAEMYYSSAQQLAYHTSCGCPMRVGDLLGSGTISGPRRDNYGSMLEICRGGKEPLILDNGDTRCFLEDDDVVRFTGAAKGGDFQIGFGLCEGRVIANKDA
jgi:fumarylacetoacetase